MDKGERGKVEGWRKRDVTRKGKEFEEIKETKKRGDLEENVRRGVRRGEESGKGGGRSK